MCIAHQALRLNEITIAIRSTPGLKRSSRKGLKDYKPIDLALYDAILGSDAVKKLRKSSTPAGISIFELAVSLGPKTQALYALFYREQSRRAHGADGVEHFELDDDGQPVARWHATTDDCSWALRVGTLMFIGCLECLTEHLELGIAVTTAIEGFGAELARGGVD